MIGTRLRSALPFAALGWISFGDRLCGVRLGQPRLHFFPLSGLYKPLPNCLTGTHIIFGHHITVRIQDKNQFAGLDRLEVETAVDVWVVLVLHLLSFSTAQ
jgi:hypothetical protein